MLFIKFHIGADAYLLDAAEVVEILPLVEFKHLPQAPAGVAGLFNYRGTPVPVVDLAQLALGRPAARLMSTRLILVRRRGSTGEPDERLLGLIAEKATETLQRAAADFLPAGIVSDAAPYLGPVTRVAEQLIQRVDIQKLLPESVSKLLYRRAVAEGA